MGKSELLIIRSGFIIHETKTYRLVGNLQAGRDNRNLFNCHLIETFEILNRLRCMLVYHGHDLAGIHTFTFATGLVSL